MDMITLPMWTLATVPWGSPKAPCIPVWSLLASPGQKIVDEFPGEDWFSACKQSLIAYSFYLGVGPGENSSQVLLPSQIHVSGNSAL